jgi:hypothetical protein
LLHAFENEAREQSLKKTKKLKYLFLKLIAIFFSLTRMLDDNKNKKAGSMILQA